MAVPPKRRARGSGAFQHVKFEETYGASPGGNYIRLPFVSSMLGAEQGLIESDLLGQGREPYDPSPDVINNAGDHVVPVDVRGFGHWLKLLFGAPDTSALPDDMYEHVFTSGADQLPSMSIELALPAAQKFGMNYGVRGNTLRIGMSRRGLLNATLGLIAKGETVAAASAAGTPQPIDVERFAQATGEVRQNGVLLGNVVSAEFGYSNNLDPVETIRPDGEIEDADPGMSGSSSSITVRFAGQSLFDKAVSGEPVALSFGWSKGPHSLVFENERVFLPRPKTPISGPNGIQATFQLQASGADGHVLTATLINDIAAY
ncbi:MAG: phage tail tube protein [Allosphingosinicella sp.]|uniref:phage tail tube protein n=1 Tax=Allosphingosinicella sp. TaxID=2823234 RepID=UPI003937B9BE